MGGWYQIGTVDRTDYEVITLDEICQDELHPGPPFRSGGPFSLLRLYDPICPVAWTGTVESSSRRYTGSLYPAYDHIGHRLTGGDRRLSDAALKTLGTTGWARAKPTRPSAGLGQFLGEFRDVPRTLKGTAKSFYEKYKSFMGSRRGGGFSASSASRDWLNANFGWAPFIRDIQDFYKTTKNLEAKIAQLKRDNGQWVKRGSTIDSGSEATEWLNQDTPGHTPTLDPSLYESGPPYGHMQGTRTISYRTWFEARFKYWIPTLESSPWDLRSKALIYGVLPTPDLVWELLPWSWLVDWVANVGDVLSNVTDMALNNLVAKYAYVMHSTSEEMELTMQTFLKGGPVTSVARASVVTKQRLSASPFGFGLSSPDFSAWQWSILGALGLSRLR